MRVSARKLAERVAGISRSRPKKYATNKIVNLSSDKRAGRTLNSRLRIPGDVQRFFYDLAPVGYSHDWSLVDS